jgi:pimeloyl-ACP methyl ester carboxylesterase
MAVSYLDTKQGRRLAYVLTKGVGPTIVFCGGLKSDMNGTKALDLESWAQAEGRNFLRFDYSGHGQSSNAYEDTCIGDWHQDALAVIDGLTSGPVVLVGSSMGGWQSLLLARERADRIAGLVTIAAAPDFTEDGWWAGFDATQRALLAETGQVNLPSDYMEPFVVTQRMIDDGRLHLVLRSALDLPFPVRFLQGTDDSAVSVETATRLLAHATGPDMQLLLVKDADHRFSDDACLDLIRQAVADVIGAGK